MNPVRTWVMLARFSLSGTTQFGLFTGAPAGCARVISAAVFNFEANPGPFAFNLTVCDDGSPVMCRVASLSVSVDDVNEPPVRGCVLHATALAVDASPSLALDSVAFASVCNADVCQRHLRCE